ncbi:hypothetical protein [Moraxella canis]|nr:hypothetical protein [Moraxella canis]
MSMPALTQFAKPDRRISDAAVITPADQPTKPLVSVRPNEPIKPIQPAVVENISAVDLGGALVRPTLIRIRQFVL